MSTVCRGTADAPVGVRVHDVQVCHQVRRRSCHDGSDDGRLDANRFLQEPLHPGPVLPFRFPEEADPVSASPAGSDRDSANFGRRMLLLLDRFAFTEPDASARLEGNSPKRNSAPCWFISLKFSRAFSSSSVAMKVKVKGCGFFVSFRLVPKPRFPQGSWACWRLSVTLRAAIGRGAEADRIDGALPDG